MEPDTGPGLVDRRETLRPAVAVHPVRIAQVKALACRPPADDRAPLPRWSCPELARQAVADDICQAISAPTVRRWLAQDAINPGSTTLTTKPSHPLSSHTTESPDSPGQSARLKTWLWLCC